MPGPYPLATLAPTVGPAGITTPAFFDILASLQASYRSIYGADTYLESDSQDGQWVALQAQVVYDFNQALIAGYLSYSPTWAQGVGLSTVVKINGIRRRVPSYSTADLTLIGQAGLEITNGVVSDSAGNFWALPPLVTIAITGEALATATCTTPGAVNAGPGSINVIETPMPGWQSATNPAAAQPGFPLEDDATLRQRQTFSTSLPATTPRLAIKGALANLPGVNRVEVYDNDTNLYDQNGIPPHSIAVVIEGGDATQIATTTLFKKNTGCGSYGSTQITVIDQAGVPQPINFWRLAEVPIWATVQLRALGGYLDSYGGMIAQAVAAYIDGLAIGQDVYAGWLYAPADLAGDVAMATSGLTQPQLDRISATYVVEGILLATAPFPTSSADVAIAFNQAASCPLANLTIQIQ